MISVSFPIRLCNKLLLKSFVQRRNTEFCVLFFLSSLKQNIGDAKFDCQPDYIHIFTIWAVTFQGFSVLVWHLDSEHLVCLGTAHFVYCFSRLSFCTVQYQFLNSFKNWKWFSLWRNCCVKWNLMFKGQEYCLQQFFSGIISSNKSSYCGKPT